RGRGARADDQRPSGDLGGQLRRAAPRRHLRLGRDADRRRRRDRPVYPRRPRPHGPTRRPASRGGRAAPCRRQASAEATKARDARLAGTGGM
ncbi:MAG: hypothetical protein AVDCRST_MAG18-2716, partial [uncultured Thermomicrobiales bacterium]